MPYHHRICAAAEAGNEALLRQILSEQNACIDERDASESFHSPAGKLAKIGNFPAAELLMNKFGASITLVVYGLIDGEHTNQARTLTEEYDLDISQDSNFHLRERLYRICYVESREEQSNCYHHTKYSANAGDIEFISRRYNSLFEEERNLFQYAAHGGHLYFLEKIYATSKKFAADMGAQLTVMSFEGDVGCVTPRFQNHKVALHTLSFIQNKAFFYLLTDQLIKRSNTLDYNIIEIAAKAEVLHELMNNYQWDYPTALLAYEQNDILRLPRNFSHKKNNLFFSTTTNIQENAQGDKCLATHRQFHLGMFFSTTEWSIKNNNGRKSLLEEKTVTYKRPSCVIS